MGKLFAWFKEHPKESAVFLGIAAVGAFFLLRGSGGGSSSTQATDVAASLQTQQLNAQTGIAMAEIAASQQNAQLAAQVQNNQTNAAVQAATLQYGFLGHAVDTEAGLQSAQLTEYAHLADLAEGDITKIGGSQNRLALLQSILGQPSAAAATEASYAQVNNPAYGAGAVAASITGSVAKGLLGGFFG